MLEVIESIEIDPENRDFVSLTRAERIHDFGFEISKGLRVSFEPNVGGKVALSAVNPEISAPHYRIRPIKMGAANWYSMEYDIAGKHLDNIGQIVPTLDAASPQSVTLFALLRIFYKDGRSEDVSSLQVELRRNRMAQAFPISLRDLPTLAHGEITTARLIFFIEARDVVLDVYGLTVTSVRTAKAHYGLEQVRRMRGVHAASPSPSLKRQRLDVDAEALWTGETSEHRPITPEVFLDFQPGEGRRMTVARQGGMLAVDFSETASGDWRNLEFRFEDVHNTGSITVLLYAKGKTGAGKPLEAGLVLREYDEDMVWEDTSIPVTLTLLAEEGGQLRRIDLSPLLSDKRNVHCFGIMMFLPPETEVLQIEEMDAFVFDREIV